MDITEMIVKSSSWVRNSVDWLSVYEDLCHSAELTLSIPMINLSTSIINCSNSHWGNWTIGCARSGGCDGICDGWWTMTVSSDFVVSSDTIKFVLPFTFSIQDIIVGFFIINYNLSNFTSGSSWPEFVFFISSMGNFILSA